jgi:4'-phosphopantetheinyl transferase
MDLTRATTKAGTLGTPGTLATVASVGRWPPAPASCQLAPNTILLLCASLDLPPARLDEVTALLSQAELERAGRFHFQRDRQRSIASRALLRILLGGLLALPPQRLQFSNSAQGKPALTGPDVPAPLHFNLAHAGSLVVFAVTHEGQIGVDIECHRTIDEVEHLADQLFSEQEKAQWRTVPPRRRTEAFLNYWTRKEACLKAIGRGITGELTEIEVTLLPDQPAEVIGEHGSKTSGRWRLFSFTPAHGYVGALAIPGGLTDAQIHCHEWKP